MVTPAINAYYYKGRAGGQTPPLKTCWVHEIEMAAEEDCVSLNEVKLFQREQKLFWRNLPRSLSVCAARPRQILLNQLWSRNIFWWKNSSLKTNIFLMADTMHFCLIWKKILIYVGRYLLFLINLFNFSELSEERSVQIQSVQMRISVFSTFLSLASLCDFWFVGFFLLLFFIQYSVNLTEIHSSFEFFFFRISLCGFCPIIPGKVKTLSNTLVTAALEVSKVLFMYRRKCLLSQGAYLRPD